MRHPPSAGCLFGQTGCLTAQAVDGILMDMTNDSLASLDFSRFHPTLLFPLSPPSPIASLWKETPEKSIQDA